MLVIKPSVNYCSIDEEVWIHNVRMCSNGIYEYRIKKPEGYDHHKIYHKRNDGWKILTEKVLRILNKNG